MARLPLGRRCSNQQLLGNTQFNRHVYTKRMLMNQQDTSRTEGALRLCNSAKQMNATKKTPSKHLHGKFSKPGPHKAPKKRSVPCGMHVNCPTLLVHPPPSPKYEVEGLRRCAAKNKHPTTRWTLQLCFWGVGGRCS